MRQSSGADIEKKIPWKARGFLTFAVLPRHHGGWWCMACSKPPFSFLWILSMIHDVMIPLKCNTHAIWQSWSTLVKYMSIAIWTRPQLQCGLCWYSPYCKVSFRSINSRARLTDAQSYWYRRTELLISHETNEGRHLNRTHPEETVAKSGVTSPGFSRTGW